MTGRTSQEAATSSDFTPSTEPLELAYTASAAPAVPTNQKNAIGVEEKEEKPKGSGQEGQEKADVIPAFDSTATRGTTSSGAQTPVTAEPEAKKEHWLEKTELVLPKNNLYIVFTGLMLTVFLSALDQTIVSTALPTIAADLKSGATGYSWVGSAYLLASTAVIPLYGRASDLVGRKPMLWLAMILFLFGSAMCGAAQSTTWLSICRGVQGLGGGGTISLANILIGDLVPLSKRGNYAGLYGFVWGLASVLGPILGGIISQNTTWRWIFFLNLPVGGAAFVVLFFTLKLNPHPKKSTKQYIREFDKIGYVIILAAVIIFLLGFTFAETDGFASPKAIACIVVGACLFPVFVAYEFWAEKKFPSVKPIVPPRLFRTRTTALLLVGVACHSLSFFAAAYYLPLYYQAITGSTATLSAVQMLPFSLVSALTSAASGFLVTYLGRYRIIMQASFALFTVGMGLMTMLVANTSVALQEVYPLIAGIGLGCLFQTPMVALTAAMPPAEMATSVASLALVRTAAGTVGITVAGSIFNSGVASRIKNIPEYLAMIGGASASQVDLRGLVHIQPPALAHQVVEAYGDSLRLVWIVLTPIVGIGFLSTLGLKNYSLKRKVVQNGKQVDALPASTDDVERQQEDEKANEESDSEDVMQKESRSGSSSQDIEQGASEKENLSQTPHITTAPAAEIMIKNA
ncbi:hypothetical protein CBS101457_005824 [Exobasidium rhododendri]|nr:hypothetical protein CBS101457_005824 [Exobasidium rhododendri]